MQYWSVIIYCKQILGMDSENGRVAMHVIDIKGVETML